MIKWLLKKSIWATEEKKWHGVSHNDESDVFHTFSSGFQHFMGPAPIFGQILYIFWSFLGDPRFPQGGTKVKILNCYIIYCAMGTPKMELVKHYDILPNNFWVS